VVIVHPITERFGAEIGLDTRGPFEVSDIALVEAALDRFSVLVFPDQDLGDEQQMAFAARFGPLETNTGVMRTDLKRRLREGLGDVSNLDENNDLLAADDRRRGFNLGNQIWHTDSSFKRLPAKASLLYAKAVPPVGGFTEFADLRAAYDALPEATRQRIDGLIAEHSIEYSRARIGFSEFSPEERARLPPVQQVVVRTHAGSGRRTLYLAAHAGRIVGWDDAEGARLIDELMAHATQPQFVYRHRWRANDLVMWDNRCTMHRGRPFDDVRYKRDMQRATVSDVGGTVEQEAARRAA
jgi:alpha-ketoglutarate-dependent 2,4-dichlorophenoxyacetate dioxygenase